jgi:hypothetical protein
MRREPNTARRGRGVALLACLGCLLVLLAGCSSGKSKAKISVPPVVSNLSIPSSSSAALPSSSAPTTPTTAAAGGLSGSWSGQYSGAFSGTFKLTWVQTGADLSGTILLSTENSPTVLTGTVSGSTITFGTVGSTAITYRGTVSGSSMSGSYQVGGAPGGNWSATKS